MALKDLLSSHPNAMSVALFGAGFAVATLVLRYRSRSPRGLVGQSSSNTTNSVNGKGDHSLETKVAQEEYKMVLVVRTDLKMGKGKMAAQCAHAAVGAVEKLAYVNMAALRHWQNLGQPKVVLKVDGLEALFDLDKVARSKSITTCLISDAGRTQIAAGSKTVLALGPGPASVIDQITGHLKLL
ncbi:unnamed protein product [Candidula unifasciata]|uniref:peptidyl-tRNA hydrolase n=1 Tax=Candidula unifasciata TaxID=100452 RepID=A0A8S3Z6S2_9EUPU|nr:unnamed protein product [Candidula unifasciata]